MSFVKPQAAARAALQGRVRMLGRQPLCDGVRLTKCHGAAAGYVGRWFGMEYMSATPAGRSQRGSQRPLDNACMRLPMPLPPHCQPKAPMNVQTTTWLGHPSASLANRDQVAHGAERGPMREPNTAGQALLFSFHTEQMLGGRKTSFPAKTHRAARHRSEPLAMAMAATEHASAVSSGGYADKDGSILIGDGFGLFLPSGDFV